MTGERLPSNLHALGPTIDRASIETMARSPDARVNLVDQLVPGDGLAGRILVRPRAAATCDCQVPRAAHAMVSERSRPAARTAWMSRARLESTHVQGTVAITRQL